jgi:two-component system, response regulator PdtaR
MELSHVTLPPKGISGQEESSSVGLENGGSVNQPRILVCESEGVIALDIQKSLQEMGYRDSVIASTGEGAVAAARSMGPTLIIIEIQLKGALDGIQAAELIRQYREVPAIYLSTSFDKATFERAKRTQPCGYLIKPFSPSQFEASIALALSNSGQGRTINCTDNFPESGGDGQLFRNPHSITQPHGAIPICSCCKSVRDDSGSWEQPEDYFTERFGVRFTHSLCPECIKAFRCGLQKPGTPIT